MDPGKQWKRLVHAIAGIAAGVIVVSIGSVVGFTDPPPAHAGHEANGTLNWVGVSIVVAGLVTSAVGLIMATWPVRSRSRFQEPITQLEAPPAPG